jgi:hypothetical protein
MSFPTRIFSPRHQKRLLEFCIEACDKTYLPSHIYFNDQLQFGRMASRAAQIAGHLNYPRGLLAGQVAIITGSGQGIGAEGKWCFYVKYPIMSWSKKAK